MVTVPGRLAWTGQVIRLGRTLLELCMPYSVETSPTPGSFPGPENVVHLAPAVTTPLLALHAAYHAHVAGLGLDCAAAARMARESRAFGPARVVSVGLLEFPPVRTVSEFPIGDSVPPIR